MIFVTPKRSSLVSNHFRNSPSVLKTAASRISNSRRCLLNARGGRPERATRAPDRSTAELDTHTACGAVSRGAPDRLLPYGFERGGDSAAAIRARILTPKHATAAFDDYGAHELSAARIHLASAQVSHAALCQNPCHGSRRATGRVPRARDLVPALYERERDAHAEAFPSDAAGDVACVCPIEA